MKPNLRSLSFLLLLVLMLFSCDKNTPFYTLTKTVLPKGGGSITSITSSNGKLTLLAIPTEHYTFKGWSGNITGDENPVIINVNSNLNITALFEPKSYVIDFSFDGEGTVTVEIITLKSGSYPFGTTVRLTAVPEEGWEFVEWQGDITGNENPVEYTITSSDPDITAIFRKKSYPLNITIEGEGTVTEEIVSQLKTSYDYETIVRLTPVPNEGWEFVGWTGDLTGSDNPVEVTITDSTNITCAFERMRTYVPDDNFEQYLIDQGWDDVLDDYVYTSNIQNITTVDIDNHPQLKSAPLIQPKPTLISDLTGIEDFTSLLYLYCSGNNLTSLDISNNTSLLKLHCAYNNLTNLDVSSLTSLEYLFCEYNKITSLNVSNLTSLKVLNCRSQNGNENLKTISNRLSSLNVSNCTSLISIDCTSNNLTSLDVSTNTSLTSIQCRNNDLTSLDVSSNTSLTTLDCRSNQLTCIKVNQAQLNSIPGNWEKDAGASYSVDCSRRTYVPDNNFEQYLIDQGWDDVLDDYVYTSNIENRTAVDISVNPNSTLKGHAPSYFVSDLTGIKDFTSLATLNCSYNRLTSLDVSNLTSLETLNCRSQISNDALKSIGNRLSSLNVSNCTSLTSIDCSTNDLTSLELSSNTLLTTLYCNSNRLTSLDVSDLTSLTTLDCSNNSLTCIQVNQTQLNSIPANWTKDNVAGYSLDCSR